jgi:hypothetical protein
MGEAQDKMNEAAKENAEAAKDQAEAKRKPPKKLPRLPGRPSAERACQAVIIQKTRQCRVFLCLLF